MREPVRKIPIPGTKDANGAFVPEPPMDLSIDSLLKNGLEAIHGVMKSCLRESKSGVPSRESVMNLKDCIAMLNTLKDKEDALLSDMDDEALAKAAERCPDDHR